MRCDRESLLLYGVTDRYWLNGRQLSEVVEEAISGGVSFLQLREKKLATEDFVTEAKKIKRVTDYYRVPFVINDNIEVAMACDADGVHVGQTDLNARRVRELIGSEKILGVSAQTLEQALKAQEDGADYIGVGAIFSTDTKKEAQMVSKEVLSKMCTAVEIPVIAIGGLTENNLDILKNTGIDGIAVVSAIFGKTDIREATKRLKKKVIQLVQS